MKKFFFKSLAIGLLALLSAVSWAQTAVPYTETFESYSSGLPTGWSKIGNGTVAVVANTNWSTYSHAGTKSLKFSGATSNPVAMPQFTAEISTLQLVFWTKPESNNSSCGKLEVGYLTNPSNQFTFVAVETYNYSDNGGAYSEKTVLMPKAPAGSVFAFRHVPTSTSWYWFVDDVQVTVAPTCKKTANIAVSSITSSGATISWNTVDGASAYDVTVGTHVFSGVTDTFKVVSGLLKADTVYSVSVVTDCGGGDKSQAKATSFKTKCEAISSFPWIEDFESYTSGTNVDCWDNSASTTSDLSTNPSYVWGVTSANSNKSIYMRNNNVHAGTALINTQSITLTSGKNFNLIFDYCHNASCGDFNVKISENGGQSFTTVGTYPKNDTKGSYSNPATWATDEEISLASYAGKTIIIQFFSTANWGSGAIFVDNVRVQEASSCVKPTDLTSSEETVNSAKLAWTAGGSETAWKLQYKNVTDANWTEVSGTVASPYTLTGLSKGTDYEFQVNAICGASDESGWSKSGYFTTACDAMNLGILYGFESEAQNKVPTCWKVGNYISSGWESSAKTPIVYDGTSCAKTGSKSLKMQNNGYYCKPYAAMPKLPDGIKAKELEVSAYAYSPTAVYYDIIEVGMMKDSTDYSSFVRAGYIPVRNSKSYNLTTVSFANINCTDDYRYVCFRWTTTNSSSNYTIYLDDITVTPKPKMPTDVRIIDIDTTTATIKFHQDSPKGKWGVQVATDANFNDKVKDVTITDSTLNLTGLLGSTNYFVRVKHIDSTYSVESDWTDGKATFTTLCATKKAPFTENFNTTASLPACWSKVSSSFSPNVNGNKLYFTQAGAAFLPELDYSEIDGGILGCAVSFEAYGDGDTVKVIVVDDPAALDPDDLDDQLVVGSDVLTADNKYYEFYMSDVEATIGDKRFIGIYVCGNPNTNLDTLRVFAASARIPEQLTITVLNPDSAQITFVQNNPYKGKGWRYQYSTNSNFAGADTLSLSKNAEQVINMGGLKDNKKYYFRIRQAGVDDDAPWATTEFTTPCAPLTFNKVYDFDDVDARSTCDYKLSEDKYFSTCWSRGTTYSSSWYPYYYMPFVTNASGKVCAGNSLVMFSYSTYYSFFALPAFAETQDMTDVIVSFVAKATYGNTSNNKLRVGTTSGISGTNANFTLVEEKALTTDWKRYEVKFADYEGTDSLIMFYAANNNSSYPICIDSIIVTQVSCKNPKPTVSNITSSSAVVASGLTTGANWAYKIGTDGTINNVFGTEASVTLNELYADMDYTVYVQAKCSATDTSDWRSVSFHTLCAPVEANGYSEDFSGGIPFCMKAVTTSESGSTCGMGAGAVNIKKAAIVLPEFSTTDFSGLMMTYKAHSTLDPREILLIAYMDTANAVLADQTVIDTLKVTGSSSMYEFYFGDIANFNTLIAGKRLAFRAYGNSNAYVDDIAITPAKSVRTPENLTLVSESETTDGATLTFEQPGTSTGKWAVEVAKYNSFSPIVKYDTVTTNPFTLTGLGYGSSYYVRIKQISDTEASLYSNYIGFSTACVKVLFNAVDSLEQYNATTTESYVSGYVPTCWKTGQVANNYSSAPIGILQQAGFAHSGNKSISISAYKSGSTYYKSWISMPAVETTDMKLVSVTFWARAKNFSDTLEVGVMSDPSNSATYKRVYAFKPTSEYVEYTVRFDEYDGDGTYITFVNNAKSYTFYIDDILVKESACTLAQNVEISAQANSADVSISNATPNWNIVVKEGEDAVFTQNGITTASVQVTGLKPSVNYTAEVTMNCPQGGESDAVVKDFTTTCLNILTEDDLPLFEDFKKKSLSDCWGKINMDNSNVIDRADRAKSGKYLLEFTNATTPRAIVLPEMDFDLSNYQLSFWSRAWSSSYIGDLKVALTDVAPATDDEVIALEPAFTTTMTDVLTEYQYQFYKTNTTGKKFVVIYLYGAGDICVDDIKVEKIEKPWEMIRSGLSNAQLGTVCQSKNIVAVRGGELFGVEYGNTSEVTFIEKALPIAAGEPMLFKADGTNNGKIEVLFGDEEATVARHDEGKDGVKGLVGLISTSAVNKLDIESGNILVSGGRLRLTGTGCWINPDRAYIKTSEMPATGSSAPGRRIRLTADGMNIVTNMTEVEANADGAFKFVRDGQMFILREGKLFNAQGQYLR